MSTTAKLTFAEYLELERRAEFRHEFRDGQVVERAPSSYEHNIINGNLAHALGNQLEGGRRELFVVDMRVLVDTVHLCAYPDIAVTNGPEFLDREQDTLLNPIVIIEVVSRSTEAYDRGEKLAHYRRLKSLQEVVLVEQDRMSVEHWVRQGDQWCFTALEQPDGLLVLDSIDCQVPLRTIYAKKDIDEQAKPYNPHQALPGKTRKTSLPPFDSQTTVADLKRWVLEFSQARDWEQFHHPKDLGLALACEVGELLEHFRYRTNDEVAAHLADQESSRALSHELADCLWLILRLADVCGINLSASLHEKLELADRKYPVEKSRGRPDKYTAYRDEASRESP